MSTEIELITPSDFSQIDSTGVFAKRRRNLIIVSIVIILFAFLKPKLEAFTLSGINFEFKGYSLFLWIGLSFWFGYAGMRARAFYKTYLGDAGFYFKEYVYWSGIGRNRWIRIAKEAEKNLKNEMIVDAKRDLSLNLQADYEDVIRFQIKNGNIPGIITLDFVLLDKEKNNDEIFEKTVSKKVEFNMNPDMEEYTKQRKSQYRTLDNWWEYDVLKIFAIAGFVFLIVGFCRNITGL
jgi:hypothetical protein